MGVHIDLVAPWRLDVSSWPVDRPGHHGRFAHAQSCDQEETRRQHATSCWHARVATALPPPTGSIPAHGAVSDCRARGEFRGAVFGVRRLLRENRWCLLSAGTEYCPAEFGQTPQPALVAFLAVEFRPFTLRYDALRKGRHRGLSFSFYLWSGPSPVRSGQSGRQTVEVVSGCGRLIAANATPPLVAPAALEATQPVSLRPAREFSRGLASC